MSTPHHAIAPTVPVPDPIPLRRVLVSVYDKAGLDQLATALKAAGIEVVSTGGTARALEAHGVNVTDVAAVTGFPEILDGRVKTLHPNVFAGLLYRRDRPDDIDIVARHGIGPIDAVIVNLYPFEAIVAQPDCRPADAIELIDIGGPSLVRAAAKNHAFTAVVTGPDQYPEIIATIARGGTTIAERRLLAARAFERTAAYDTAIAAWMARHAGLVAEPQSPAPGPNTLDAAPLPARFSLELQERLPLRYGENPHQSAALYAPAGSRVGLAGSSSLREGALLHNLLDLDGRRSRGAHRSPAATSQAHQPLRCRTAATIDAALGTAIAADRRCLRLGRGGQSAVRQGLCRVAPPAGAVRRGDRRAGLRSGGGGIADHEADLEGERPARRSAGR